MREKLVVQQKLAILAGFAAEKHTKMYRWSFAPIIALMIALPVFAHHGNAAYETTKTVTITGTITDFQFVNPYVMVFLT